MNHQHYSVAFIAALSLTAMMLVMFEYNQEAKAAAHSSQTVCVNGQCRSEEWTVPDPQQSQPQGQSSGIDTETTTICRNNEPCQTETVHSQMTPNNPGSADAGID